MMKWVTAFENAEWGIVISPAGTTKLEMMNPAFVNLFGYTLDELKGKPLECLYTMDDRENLPSLIKQAHENGSITFKANLLRKDGSTFYAQVDMTTVKDQLGKDLYWIANVQDITDRKRAVEEVSRRDNILESVAFATEKYLQKGLVGRGVSKISLKNWARQQE